METKAVEPAATRNTTQRPTTPRRVIERRSMRHPSVRHQYRAWESHPEILFPESTLQERLTRSGGSSIQHLSRFQEPGTESLPSILSVAGLSPRRDLVPY